MNETPRDILLAVGIVCCIPLLDVLAQLIVALTL